MKKITFLLFLTLLTTMLCGQDKLIPTTEYLTKNYYTSITYLSEGNSKLIKTNKDSEIDTGFRVIILTSEIYDNLIIEKVTYGEEGGNKQIISKRKVDLDFLWKTFSLNGEISNLIFVKWLTWNSFELRIFDKNYIVKDIDKTTIKVQIK